MYRHFPSGRQRPGERSVVHKVCSANLRLSYQAEVELRRIVEPAFAASAFDLQAIDTGIERLKPRIYVGVPIEPAGRDNRSCLIENPIKRVEWLFRPQRIKKQGRPLGQRKGVSNFRLTVRERTVEALSHD